MIFLFYGADTFSSREKLAAVKTKNASVNLGALNLVILPGEELTLDQFSSVVQAVPFLAASRFVIVENLLLLGRKDVEASVAEYLKRVPSSTILVFWEGGVPDRRGKLWNALQKNYKTQEFKPLEGAVLKRWVQARADEKGLKLAVPLVERLVFLVGSDLWRMERELEKLALLPTVDEVVLNTLVRPTLDESVFRFIDEIARKNVGEAYRALHRLIDQGENPVYLLSMIVYQFRNMLMLKDAEARGKRLPLQPFVYTKTVGLNRGYELADLKQIYRLLLAFDFKIKTGKIEPALALDLLVGMLGEGRVFKYRTL